MNVLITGASGGLGRALAAECARRGYRIFLTDLNEGALAALRSGLERQYGVCVAAKACDLTSESSVAALLEVADHCGIRFDLLLNVAGLDFEGGFLTRERVDISKIVSLNIEATLRITHAVLARRIPGRRFSVVFVSSLASLYPMPLKATYAASKRFLLDFSIALRQELKDQQVNVLALCPGGLPTTKEAMQGIAAQGFWGDVTTNRLETVAKNTIDRALRSGGIYIPGVLNKALSLVGKLIPRSWVAALIFRRWNKAQGKWIQSNCG